MKMYRSGTQPNGDEIDEECTMSSEAYAVASAHGALVLAPPSDESQHESLDDYKRWVDKMVKRPESVSRAVRRPLSKTIRRPRPQ
ncbi:hypothetical protein GCM10025784_11750 [Citricoccus nitrophenolicus]